MTKYDRLASIEIDEDHADPYDAIEQLTADLAGTRFQVQAIPNPDGYEYEITEETDQ